MSERAGWIEADITKLTWELSARHKIRKIGLNNHLLEERASTMEKGSENLRITAFAFIWLLQIRIIIITSRLQKQSIKPIRQYRTSFYIFSVTLSTMPILFPIMSLLIIWKFGIVLSHFERLRMLARAIKVPHLEERTFQIPYLNNNVYTKVR